MRRMIVTHGNHKAFFVLSYNFLPQIGDDEICGCPLTKDVFNEAGDLCKTAKKHCNDHFRWERMRRAEIDADKVRQVFRCEVIKKKGNVRITGKFDNAPKIYCSDESRFALRFTLTPHGLSGLLATFSEVNRCAM